MPKHDTDVDVVQLVVAHSASESTADWERSVGAKFMPVSVVLAEIDATLYGADAVMTGASKLNTPLDVPTTLAAVRPAVPTMPLPRVPMHAADVAVVQLVVLQSASPRTAVTETSVGAKIMPVSVTLAAADATLYGAAAEITGPSNVNTALDDPTTPATVSPLVPIRPAPRVPIHATDVVVVQLVVKQSARDITAVGEALVGAKFMPVKVMLGKTDPTLYGDTAVMTGASKLNKAFDVPTKPINNSPNWPV